MPTWFPDLLLGDAATSLVPDAGGIAPGVGEREVFAGWIAEPLVPADGFEKGVSLMGIMREAFLIRIKYGWCVLYYEGRNSWPD